MLTDDVVGHGRAVALPHQARRGSATTLHGVIGGHSQSTLPSATLQRQGAPESPGGPSPMLRDPSLSRRSSLAQGNWKRGLPGGCARWTPVYLRCPYRGHPSRGSHPAAPLGVATMKEVRMSMLVRGEPPGAPSIEGRVGFGRHPGRPGRRVLGVAPGGHGAPSGRRPAVRYRHLLREGKRVPARSLRPWYPTDCSRKVRSCVRLGGRGSPPPGEELPVRGCEGALGDGRPAPPPVLPPEASPDAPAPIAAASPCSKYSLKTTKLFAWGT